MRDLIVAGPLALVMAARGVMAMVWGSAWSAPRHGPPHVLEGRQAVLFGAGYCALALLILFAWAAFSAGHRRAGLIGMVGAGILALAAFAGSLI
ncbi:MAG: hypothetical protein K2X68_06740 [Novosphingobium sp.]|nr:hypothetical protein [Novosphingobium sp.]